MVRQTQAVLSVNRLETDRLLLRGFEPTDLDDVHAFQADPAVIRFVPWPLRTRAESADWINERAAQDRIEREGDGVAWAVARRSDSLVIGSVNLWWRSQEHQQGEIGFAFASQAHGHGYASEAVSAVIDLAFSALDLHRVSGRADARNAASARLMARLGMRHEAHLREDEWFKGEWSDTVVYAVLRDEWLGKRPGISP